MNVTGFSFSHGDFSSHGYIVTKLKNCLRKKGQQVNDSFVILAQGPSVKYSLTND